MGKKIPGRPGGSWWLVQTSMQCANKRPDKMFTFTNKKWVYFWETIPSGQNNNLSGQASASISFSPVCPGTGPLAQAAGSIHPSCSMSTSSGSSNPQRAVSTKRYSFRCCPASASIVEPEAAEPPPVHWLPSVLVSLPHYFHSLD